eukprot:TRINITY_DN10971_c0_g2_i2.p2 TRINITY_DN10971_c0_g2~~TRINITY_DN10971_c0_g2_i2.p2  ORF type:complete len:311 (+),score=67.76 TRINITY_DN10971_c0_g2_i2:2267-3199(+)
MFPIALLLLAAAIAIVLFCVLPSKSKHILCPQLNEFAIVTGASSGIGLELAIQLLHAGFNVLLTAIDDADSQQMLEQIKLRFGSKELPQIKVFAGDFAEETSRSKLLQAVDKLMCQNEVSLVISNAGVSTKLPFSLVEIDAGTIDHMINVNLTTSMQLARMVTERWLQNPNASSSSSSASRRHRTMMFTASLAGLTPAPYCAVYGALKAALISFAHSLELETPDDIRYKVNCPGFVRAGQTAKWFGVQRMQAVDVVTPKQAAIAILVAAGSDYPDDGCLSALPRYSTWTTYVYNAALNSTPQHTQSKEVI